MGINGKLVNGECKYLSIGYVFHIVTNSLGYSSIEMVVQLHAGGHTGNITAKKRV